MMDRYRTFWRRFWAGLLDGLVFAPLFVVSFFVVDPGRPVLVMAAWSAFQTVAGWLYTILMHARYGQTVGKMIAGIKVLDVGETRLPTIRQSILRDSGNIVLGSIFLAYNFARLANGTYFETRPATTGVILSVLVNAWFILEVVTMLMNDKRRALHDLIAGTVVVRKDVPVDGALPHDGAWRNPQAN